MSTLANRLDLTWRNVFDSKVAGQFIGVAAKRAYEANYRYMNFNGRVFALTDGDWVDTGLLEQDVK